MVLLFFEREKSIRIMMRIYDFLIIRKVFVVFMAILMMAERRIVTETVSADIVNSIKNR